MIRMPQVRIRENLVSTFRNASLAAVAGMVLGACAQKEPPVQVTQGVPDEVVAQFVVAMDEFNPDAVRALMMPNAKIMPPNVAAISGIDNILDYYKGTLANELDFEFTREASAEAGGMAAAEGAYKVRNNTTGEYIEQGKWMAVFVNDNGTWRVARLMSNTDAPVAAPTVEVEEGAAATE
jgi:limonene-1,2-epoxide hydrolase